MKKPESLIEVEKLEKEGKLREGIKMWDNEYSRLREEKNKSKNDDIYWEISKKMAHISDKLHWAKTEQKIREVELDVRERSELRGKRIDDFEKALNDKERDIRLDVMRLLSLCSGPMGARPVSGTEEAVKKQKKEIEEEARSLMKTILKESKGDLDLIKKLFCADDPLTFGYFKILYENYKKNEPLVMFFEHITK